MTPDAAADLLGVAVDASPSDVEAAFKRSARLTHPDLVATGSTADVADASARFVAITEARDVLLARQLVSVAVPSVVPVRVWCVILVVAATLAVFGGPFGAGLNLVVLGPLAITALALAVTRRRGFLVATVVLGGVWAALTAGFASFGALASLAILLAPLVAIIVLAKAPGPGLPR
jgi:hypothetical protein